MNSDVVAVAKAYNLSSVEASRWVFARYLRQIGRISESARCETCGMFPSMQDGSMRCACDSLAALFDG